MTSPELAAAVARLAGIPDAQALLLISQVFKGVTETIFTGVPVKVDGFGMFYLHTKPPRRARNPRTGERIAVPSKVVVRFKPHHLLRGEASRRPPDRSGE